MQRQSDYEIRPALDTDVEAVKRLFTTVYGDDYPFKQFYDAWWLKKAVFEDDTLFLVAEDADGIAGTISAMYTAGGLTDLIAEFGRLVVDPDTRGKGLGSQLLGTAVEQVSEFIRFGLAEARTAHAGSQKILDQSGFVPLGFEPLKYKLRDRESMVLYGRLFGPTNDLRRNNPRIIPEIAPLALNVLDRIGLPADAVVVEDEDGFPSHAGEVPGTGQVDFTIEDLSERGWSPLLRIERGRVKGRDVFGNLSLSHGFFKIKTHSTRYLVARSGGAVLGGLGFTHDPVDQKVRIFELIGFDDAVKGRLLHEAERIATDELQAVYVEADISAYAPPIQRTLERMGFMAVAYCPSMVFEEVERLDVVRMAKYTAPYFREDIPLTAAAEGVRDLVERSMIDRRAGSAVAEAAATTDIFRELGDGDIAHLARIGRVTSVKAGTTLIREGEVPDRLFIVISGTLQALSIGKALGTIGPGETAGEIGLLDAGPRSADLVAQEETRVVEILFEELSRLMTTRPRLGTTVMRNLAADLAAKLRRADAGN